MRDYRISIDSIIEKNTKTRAGNKMIQNRSFFNIEPVFFDHLTREKEEGGGGGGGGGGEEGGGGERKGEWTPIN